MTLGDLIEDLELLAKHYALDTRVALGGYTRAGEVDYNPVESAEYSIHNDTVVIW